MPSTYTQNLNIEKPATGEQAGTWGVTANNNYDILDRALDGSISITFPTQPDSTHPYLLSTTQGAGGPDMPTGLNKVVTFTSSMSANGFVQIDPNTAQRLYFVSNQTTDSAGAGNKYSLIFQQVSSGGATFTLQQGYSAAIYADGGGPTGNVFGALDSPQFANVLITGNLHVNGVLTQGGGGSGTNIVIDQQHGLGIGANHTPPQHAIDIGDALGGEIWIDTASPASHWRQIVWSTNGSPRWSLRTSVSPAETGAGVGSDLHVANFDDSGNLLQAVLYLTRATGNVTIGPGPDQGSRLAVLGSSPGQTVLGARAAVGQTAPVLLCQDSSFNNLMVVAPNGDLRASHSVYAPSYSTGAAPGQFVGISGAFTLGGTTLYFQSGLLVQAT